MFTRRTDTQSLPGNLTERQHLRYHTADRSSSVLTSKLEGELHNNNSQSQTLAGSHYFISPSLSVYSVVCEIGPAKRVPPTDLPFEPTTSGPVEIEVDGSRRGTSQVLFTYRVGLNRNAVLKTPPNNDSDQGRKDK